MPEIHVPFTHGQSEAIDAKLLPQGYLTVAENVRYRKDGRLVSRYGYAKLSGFSPSNVVSSASADAQTAVTFTKRSAPATPATSAIRTPGGVTAAQSAGELSAPRRYTVVRPGTLSGSAPACDIAVMGTKVYCAYVNYFGGSQSFVQVADAASGAFGTLFALENGASNVKIIPFTFNAVVCVFYVVADNVRMVNIDGSGNVSAPVTVVACLAGKAPYFDVSTSASSATGRIVYVKSAIALEWGWVSSAGTFTAKATQVIALAEVRPTICVGATSLDTVVAWLEGATLVTGNAYYAQWTSAGVVTVAKTAMDSTGVCAGYPVIGSNTVDDWSAAWSNVPAAAMRGMGVYTAGKASAKYVYKQLPCSKPVTIGSGCYVWTTDQLTPTTAVKGAYYLIDIESPHVGDTGNTRVCELVSCQFQAMPMDHSVNYADPRRSGGVAVAALSSAPGVLALMTFLPIALTNGYGADMIRLEYGDYADKLLPAAINGQIVFSGGRVQEFDGSTVVESGLLDGPQIVSHTTAVGAILAGTYQYIVIWQWFDPQGRVHRSAPSLPYTVVNGGALNVTLSFYSMPFCANGKNNVSFAVYRTLASGTVFYYIGGLGGGGVSSSSAYRTYVDNAVDTAISSNEVLYTQGARGGLSGLLPNDPPPPCKFIAAGDDRVILGGLEDPSEVRWSKLIYPGEPVQYSADNAYRAHVDGEVTGVASQDGVWYVFTRDAVWVITGQGPDDTGSGSFASPSRLPADVGCISHRSIVATGTGLLFQGRSDRLYLLPRGGNAPQWIGQSVRDTLAAYPFIAWAQLVPDENCVYFACLSSDATLSKFIVFDTRLSEWYADYFFDRAFKTLCRYNGKLLIDGSIAQTSAYNDDDTGAKTTPIECTITTGDLRPFGVMGHGRSRRVVILGEYRTPSDLTLSVSYDSGATISNIRGWNIPTGNAGDTIERMYDIPRPRGPSFRYTLVARSIDPGEGLVLNSLSHEVYQERGVRRLGSAQRA